MASYKLRFNAAVRDLFVLLATDPDPANTIDAGTFEHTPGNPKTDKNVFFHYARNAMYKLGYQNMQAINLRLSASLVTYQIPTPVNTRPTELIREVLPPAPPPPPPVVLSTNGTPPPTPIIKAEYAVVGSPSVEEGNSGTTNYTYTVTRSVNTNIVSTLNWAVTGTGTYPATGPDFVGGVLPSGQLEFAVGETEKTITVGVNGDTTYEFNETFRLRISTPYPAGVILNSTISRTITNDDTAPAVTPPPPPPPPPAPTPGAINAVTVTQVNAAGTVPFEWTTAGDNTVYAGDIWRVETSADGLTNPDGSFTTPIQSITKQISPSEFEPDYIADWTTAANPAPSASFNTPSGLFYFHVSVERYTEDGTIVSPWSNVLTDTVVVATTQLHTVNGVNKNQNITVVGRTAEILNVNVGAPCMVRATQEAAPDKFVFEVLLDRLTIRKSYISLDDGSNIYGPAQYNAPGSGSRQGITLQLEGTNTDILYATADGQFGLPSCATGDIITVTGDKTTGAVSFYRTREGATIQLGATRLQPMTDWFAAVGHNQDGTFTANFGQEPFARPLDTGYSMYG